MSQGQAAIVTIVDHANFGNRLQNFALQEALAALGWDATTIRNTPPPMARRLLAARALLAVRKDGPWEFARRNGALLANRFRKRAPAPVPRYADQRVQAMTAFTKQHVTLTEEDFTERPSEEWAARFDVAITGSDQVWNHGFRNAQGIDFLTFVPESRRISYAASFGVADIPRFLRQQYTDWLNGIPSLSVREERGARIVTDLTGREVPVVVDPALLFDGGYWRDRTASADEPEDGRYGVQFFLGHASPQQRTWVADHAASTRVDLRDLADLDSPQSGALDPFGFVRQLSRAEFIATDSFHTALFALQFRRPVILRSRDETDVRLHTLMNLHGIRPTATEVLGLSKVDDADWDAVEATIRERRELSWQFLRDSLASVAAGSAA